MGPPNKDREEGPESDPVGREPHDIGTELARRRAGWGQGGDGGGDGLGFRVAKLEVHIGHIQTDLTEIKGLLGGIHQLPTKRDLTTNLAVFVTIGLAVVAIVIGGIIGGLEFIQRGQPQGTIAAPAPMIFQIPAPQSAAQPAPLPDNHRAAPKE